jgi:hypothetical protein
MRVKASVIVIGTSCWRQTACVSASSGDVTTDNDPDGRTRFHAGRVIAVISPYFTETSTALI